MEWSELETMSLKEVWKIFRHHIPDPKNYLISQLLGPKPIDCLPQELIKLIIGFLPLQRRSSLGITCRNHYNYYLDATREYCLKTCDLSPLLYSSNQLREKIFSLLTTDQIYKGIITMMKQPHTFGHRLNLLLYIYQNNYFIFLSSTNRHFSPQELISPMKVCPVYGEFLRKGPQVIIEELYSDMNYDYPLDNLTVTELDIIIKNVFDLGHRYFDRDILPKLLFHKHKKFPDFETPSYILNYGIE